MRSSFITLTFTVVCLLGSSLASPVYDKRGLIDGILGDDLLGDGLLGDGPLNGILQARAVQDDTQAAGSIVGRSVSGDGAADVISHDSGHLYKRRRILKKLLRGARRFLTHRPNLS
ncbi:uncharacterized protein RHIMIDRAFT_250104 [Rhizopus microsporus ATCC 52813]|uniref:Uncharacterized protein n=1 Tax=Rhizopus microsporus ATCC 52813 TaxID=1340429 RepID=A0A2G4T151_RHIZD|nr:uncharacterized protein RHIMIDRAFT_250104 [Rhizopus microsporus ATCC 52813]PHZ14406.1 hypothetical protein RHIMIDRAFT_250104 [Rhizopus microsporus ATCC 52813]